MHVPLSLPCVLAKVVVAVSFVTHAWAVRTDWQTGPDLRSQSSKDMHHAPPLSLLSNACLAIFSSRHGTSEHYQSDSYQWADKVTVRRLHRSCAASSTVDGVRTMPMLGIAFEHVYLYLGRVHSSFLQTFAIDHGQAFCHLALLQSSNSSRD